MDRAEEKRLNFYYVYRKMSSMDAAIDGERTIARACKKCTIQYIADYYDHG